MSFIKTTEQDSAYNHLEKMSITEVLTHINTEDKTVPLAVERALPQIELVVQQVVEKLKKGGRLFYMGAGTSGRMGILDASECPPTFGVDNNLVIGIIAGGDQAIRNAVENAEDHPQQGWLDLLQFQINNNDIVIGIAASGTTPYVIEALKKCKEHQITTACITSNAASPLTLVANYPIEVVVGPELISGSSRMKAGTAQKLVLNMISTTTMIQLGKVKGNKMVDMKMTNAKLIQRGIQIISSTLNISTAEATELLDQHQTVRQAIEHYKS
ncbi:N-acetylmuramic acid 6-phosphate etherase [Flavobacterium sp. NKUCC04_CG]|uniref:N-acetylmuramic acid 6-phosphate etherase n=1 Tax=Flavobacterium sp. NKUCC04_CG TaxID=2842121 RepID=UPI001C5A633D|nr:N-acetylmuramic acid 6-phosphate etherase [Flavobacterium sp. NKUCC04_CG]MBW3518740.1 N-acetylmuramic acid 6-phosphate etherase [Flavobacterium sp. NKUCC04_CG]